MSDRRIHPFTAISRHIVLVASDLGCEWLSNPSFHICLTTYHACLIPSRKWVIIESLLHSRLITHRVSHIPSSLWVILCFVHSQPSYTDCIVLVLPNQKVNYHRHCLFTVIWFMYSPNSVPCSLWVIVDSLPQICLQIISSLPPIPSRLWVIVHIVCSQPSHVPHCLCDILFSKWVVADFILYHLSHRLSYSPYAIKKVGHPPLPSLWIFPTPGLARHTI